MVKHLVLVKLNEGISREDSRVREVAALFESLPLDIPSIIKESWRTGFNFAQRPFGSDWALSSEFEDEAAFGRYLSHPAHIAAVNLWKEIATWTYCDFGF